MGLTLSEHATEGWAEMTVSGRVTEAELAPILGRLERLVQKSGPIRLVEVIADFEGYDPGAMRPLEGADGHGLAQVTHMAVVCDRGWLGPVSRAVGSVKPVTIRTFTSHDRDAARMWAAGAG
ncbi:MAG: STAS/SEC14 domain-containing protein [Paracoccaceae bacterium]|nr:STAS/SEC14 domain-containing protein [Paracoccaceae bacterium]